MQTYRGYEIYKCDVNSGGMKYYTRTNNGILRADSLEGIKRLIRRDGETQLEKWYASSDGVNSWTRIF